MADVVRWGDPQPAACSLSQGGHREISSCGPPCVENMQPLQNGGHSGVKGSTFTGPWVSGLPCLTFGVVALHQARLSDLYVEGFVLLVLLIVDYFHLDGFTEEEEEGGGRKRGGRRKKRSQKSKKVTDWKLENWEKNRKEQHLVSTQAFEAQISRSSFFNFNRSSDQVTRENSVLIIKRLFSLHHHPQSTSFKPDIWCQIKLRCYLSSWSDKLCSLPARGPDQGSVQSPAAAWYQGIWNKKQKLESRGWTVYQLY